MPRDERMLRLYEVARTIAVGDISVLVLGETGVGKELLAQAIQLTSRAMRRRSSSLANSAALPGTVGGKRAIRLRARRLHGCG